MRKRLLLAFFCLCALVGRAEKSVTCLVVYVKDGSRQTYVLKDRPQVTFTASDMVVKSKEVKAQFALKQLARFAYEDLEPTGIDAVAGEKTTFEVEGASIRLSHLPQGSSIRLYAQDGRLVEQHKIENGGTFVFSLLSFSRGMYLLQVNGVSSKIMIP